MRKFSKVFALFLCLILLLTSCNAQNDASITIVPDNLTIKEQKWLDEDKFVRYTSYNYKSDTKESLMHTVELKPGSDIMPLVGWSGKITGTPNIGTETNSKTVPKWAEYYEGLGYRVFSAINGDYFHMSGSTGTKSGQWFLASNQTMGKLMTNGIIHDFGVTARQGEDTNADCMGIFKDGKSIIGRPITDVTVSLKEGTPYEVEFINRIWNNNSFFNDIMVFNEEYGRITPVKYGTQETSATYLVVCQIEKGKFAFNDKVTAKVKEKLIIKPNYEIDEESKPTTPLIDKVNCYDVKADEMVIACEDKNFYEDCKFEDELELNIELLNKEWEKVDQIIGGRCQIMSGGEMENFDLGSGDNGLNPRSIVGIKEDGTIMTITVDGRQPEAPIKRFNLDLKTEIIPFLKELGVVDALLFDGGGSVTLTTRNEEGKNLLTNMTSNNIEGTTMRSIVTALLFAKPPKK